MSSTLENKILLHVVHLDDNPFELDRVRGALSQSVLGANFVLESFSDATELERRLKTGSSDIDVAILDFDLGVGKGTGSDVVKIVRNALPECAILMCSAVDHSSVISQCLLAGADDFISKQSQSGELGLRVLQSYRLSALKRGASDKGRDDEGIPSLKKYAGITMQKIASRMPRILSSAITSLYIHGESGTGKEVVSEILESALPENTPFVRVNCGAISPSLLESELFGHAKGAFTGAVLEKKGLLESASSGWIFLDEIATLSSAAQVALLRAIENQEVLRVGDHKPRKIQVRFVSATNEDLEGLVSQGKFRKDLWQRLREAEIVLPPLRERVTEIPELVSYFCNHMPFGPYTIEKPALDVLCAAPWSEGNIRELRNCLRAMTEFHVGNKLTPVAIPSRIWEAVGDHDPKEVVTVATPANAINTIVIPIEGVDGTNYDLLSDKLLLELARKFGAHGKVSMRGLARQIGMSRSTLSGRLKGLVQKQLVTLQELSNFVGVNEV